MANFTGAKARMMRRFQEVYFRSPKYNKIQERRPNPPGQHGPKTRRGKKSEFGKRLEEKQKLRFRYNILEKQMRRYVKRAFNSKGVSGHTLYQLLERRLDNVVYRLGFASTIWAARQLVNHGHVLVNGKKVDIASYEVRIGEVVSLKEKMTQNAQILESIKNCPMSLVPAYLETDRDKFSGKLVQLPERDQIPEKIDEQLIVEYYSKYV
ncbi:30S ribosomal protein S4 [Acanthopleuribacter pedis]|uniref:Small ribosomal subunit protein uS4 n=1 Tax=Acanthopleuribacter pedis TaxID=442870 RepID=A0A8J7QK25_9BACT|nr:30S ribosomal protein S4 [Acanthopleuribacter pedis]MBO1319643.1 30S ribosomal protein S4 [Acanthopleuribacter pedis]